MFNIALTKDKGQYLLNAINTHVKAHGLVVAGMGAVLAVEIQAASSGQVGANGQMPDEPTPSESKEDQTEAES